MTIAPLFVYADTVSKTGNGAFSTEDFFRGRNSSLYLSICPYCRTPCSTDFASIDFSGSIGWQRDACSWCNICGWWSIKCDQDDMEGIACYFSAQAILKRFLVSDPDVPMEALRAYLRKRPESVQQLHPKKFEELVASIYSEVLGYRVEYCSYCRPDLGIDIVIVENETGKKIAIQAKRYQHPIELGLIHQFYGALVDKGQQHGIFVTSGRFRAGAKSAAQRLTGVSGVQIDLADGKHLLDLLGLTNLSTRPYTAEDCPYWRAVGYLAARGNCREILGGHF